MQKHHFKEGDSVRPKHCLEMQMTVGRILKENRDFVKGFKTGTSEKIIEKGIRMIGIECHWFEKSPIAGEKPILKTHKFHSRELVPEEIAIQGEEKVIEWLEEQHK